MKLFALVLGTNFSRSYAHYLIKVSGKQHVGPKLPVYSETTY